MDNYQGDLTDIVRASGGAALGQSSDVPIWEFSTSSDDNMIRDNIFGDPFCNMRDPLLHELNVAAGSSYFTTTSCHQNSPADMLSTSNFVGANSSNASTSTCTNILAHQKEVFEDDEMHRTTATTPHPGATPPPCNIFSRIQISPNNNISPVKLSVSPCDSPVMATSSPRGGFKAAAAASAMVSSEMINVNSPKGCLIENTGPVQISSPRNLGIKRRKSQAKKVVCIPAPAAANSRPSSGEVVPSDLWAWRKYGQKPIKGSPYPRGYYRCSSSKGCSARKQVERSRTDPNMLVITYTSEHNHPWPTQRNALAGSTRSTQPPKNNNNNNNNNNNGAASKSSSAGTTSSQSQKPKEEQRRESSSNDTSLSPTINNNIASGSTGVKEEIEDIEKQMEMDDDNNDFSSEGFSQSYRPALPDHHHLSCSQSEDFFADLSEIEATDPLDLLFTQGGFNDHDQEQKESKTNLDPFSIFDWSGDT